MALLALAAGIVLAARRAWRTADNRPLISVLIAGLVAFAVQAQFSFTLAATGSLVAVMIGILSRLAVASANPARKGGGWACTPVLTPALTGGVRLVVTPALTGGVRLVVIACAAVLAWIGVWRPLAADRTCREAECFALVNPIEALDGFESAVAADPKRDLLWFKLSQGARAAARSTGDPAERRRLNERARVAQQTAIDLVPEHPGHRAHFARLLVELSKEGHATGREVASAFDAALARDPKNPGLLADAGHAAWAGGNNGSAREYLRRGSKLDPNQANLRALAALVAMAEGHFEEAEQEFSAAAQRDWHGNEDGQLQALTVWAACLVKLNRAAQAELIARDVLDHRPDWPAPRYTLGYALAMLGRRAESADAYREVIARWPDHPLAAESRHELQKP